MANGSRSKRSNKYTQDRGKTSGIQNYSEFNRFQTIFQNNIKKKCARTFDLYAKNQEKSICINLNLSEDAFNQIFELSARKKDLREFTLVLVSIKPFEEEVIKLASLYEIEFNPRLRHRKNSQINIGKI